MKIGISANSCPECLAWSVELWGYTKAGLEKLKCAHCEHEFEAPPAASLSHLYKTERLRYPHLNSCLGTVVTSRAHEDAVAKKLGMVRTDSGTTLDGRRAKSTRRKVYRVAKA